MQNHPTKRIYSILHSLKSLGPSRISLGLYLVFTLSAIVFIAPFVAFAGRKAFTYLNPGYFLVALFAGMGVAAAISIATRARCLRFLATRKAFLFYTIGGTALLLAIEALVVQGAWFTTGWDVRRLASSADPTLEAQSDYLSHNDDYFSTYPNQLFLAGLFSRIVKLGALMGFDNSYLCLVVGSCLCVCGSILLISFVAQKMSGFAAGYCCFSTCFFFLGLSPWILVPYSDTYGMAFTSLSLWFYVCCESRFIKWPGLAFCVVIGYAIKPTVVFVGVAIVAIEAWQRITQKRSFHIKPRTPFAVLAVIASALIATLLVSTMRLPISNFDDTKSFSSSHFLMMGFNQTTGGMWASDDVALSRSMPTQRERQEANIKEWFGRVQEAGVSGTAKLLTKKNALELFGRQLRMGSGGRLLPR